MGNSKANVLIVEDETYIQEMLSATLQDAGFQCSTVLDAAAALTVLASGSFDLAFTDIRISDKTGTPLLQEIKERYPDLLVIMTASTDSARAAIETVQLGACDYIVKPFDLDQVRVSANRALEKKRLEDANREYQKYLEQTAEMRAAETRRLFYQMTQLLIRLLEIKTPFNAGHPVRVAELSRHVARELKVTEEGVRKVYLAALLHDVGMITLGDELLTKPGSLTPEEHRQVRERAALAEEVLKPILDDEEVLKYIRHHRERYDGTGHPDGLKGKLIPLGARIIAVAEAFDAMARSRPYRQARTPEQAIQELALCSDSQFDRQVVTVFVDLYDRVFRHLTPP